MINHIIFLDANFLLIPVQFKVDIYSELDRIVPRPMKLVIISAILDELKLKQEKNKDQTRLRREINLAFQLLNRISYEKRQVPRLNMELVDDIVLHSAVQEQQENPNDLIYLATNDKELKHKAHENSIPVIFLRQKKVLDISR